MTSEVGATSAPLSFVPSQQGSPDDAVALHAAPRKPIGQVHDFDPIEVVPIRTVAHFLDTRHYLGATGRGIAWSDDFGVLVLAKPTARRLPQDGTWLELVRWCLVGTPNGGSRQWRSVSRWLRAYRVEVTTVVSYSDPSQGHTGALYKACNWTWCPTWHRLFPPPSGNGNWGTGPQSVKDRWVFTLRPDDRRDELLRVKDGRVRDAA